MGPGTHARRVAGAWLIGVATAFVILGASIAPFLTPPVVRVEQDRTAVYSNTGWTHAMIDEVTQSLLGDLVFWTGDFGAWGNTIMRFQEHALTDPERAHMRDVRNVFTAFWLLVLASVVVLARTFRQARGSEVRAAAWQAVSRGAAGLAVGLVVAGAFAAVAFDAAFELFHRLFFSAGSYSFDPEHSKLIQLFPERFWSEISIAVAVVAIVLSLVTWRQARRRAIR